MKSIQERIDELAYPPTHTYKVEGLEPTGILKQRVEILKRVGNAAVFFKKGLRFLDIGCNKGWFSISKLNAPYKYVVGIDYNEEYVEVCKDVQAFANRHRGLHFFNITFRDFIPSYKFDRVMIGNAHHYLYRDANGWDWIPKLAAVMTNGGLVLIEGPKDMSCDDMDGFFPPELEIEFTNLPAHMEKYGFRLIKSEPAVAYTPGRYVWLFKKQVPRNNIPPPKEPGLVIKVNDFGPHDRVRVELASYAPHSNPIDGWVKREGNIYGWTEGEMSDLKTYLYCENEKELFNAHCDRNVFLARNGYVDLDGATINFGVSGGKLVHFDKGSVLPVSSLGVYHYDCDNGSYFIHLRQSYNTIQESIYKKIAIALATKDSKVIEECFEEVKL